ncbi:MAG: 4-hydroxy-3-methylbut-2-enyl diphosphate reductase [Armatimonadetes bacterium]|nr:4-hydroxy-3-methylbut-2-enyl diphosphate reductase [Armatimonadota bacterium]
MTPLRVVTVDEAGFCFGVRRALQLAQEATEGATPVYCLGPPIHNRQVVEKLEERGLKVVDDIDEVEEGATALVRAHGAGPNVYEIASQRGITLIDATCPFVRRVQQAARRFVEEDYQVLVLGEREHPEARAIVEHAGGKALIIEDADELPEIAIASRVAIVCQTTQRLDNLHRLVDRILDLTSELRVENTICDATTKRQEASLQVAEQVDLMIVVGGYHSANTTRLAQICRNTGTPTYHIETADELDPRWLEGKERIGITAGASTPTEAIEEVRRYIESISESRPQEETPHDEDAG